MYERHIRSLPPTERLQLLAMVAQDLAAQPGSTVEEPRRNIMELHGLGKEIWEEIDAQEYVDKLRNEWGCQAS
ncbi:MAG: hypothetical protein EPO21_14520 [Chloroflexota bacterium]|nr:MAG: hypothetical protein EPO21_14520 [Chloroflexota bacterium]